MGLAVLGLHLDLAIFKIFSNLSDSMKYKKNPSEYFLLSKHCLTFVELFVISDYISVSTMPLISIKELQFLSWFK